MKQFNLADLGIGAFLLMGAVGGAINGIWALTVFCGGILSAVVLAHLGFGSTSTDKIIEMNQASNEANKVYNKKYKQVDLKRYSSLFLLAGMSIAITSSIFAFQWKGEEHIPIVKPIGIDDDGVEVIPPPTPPPPLPPPPPPPPPIVDVVDDEELIDETQPEIVDTEADQDTEVEIKETVDKVIEDLGETLTDIEEVPEEETEPEIFVFVEKMPEFPGGLAEMMKFLSSNIKYPPIARENNIQGRVVLSFIVNEDGSISNIETLRDIGAACTEEAIRVVKKMPKWSPGEQRDKKVKVKYTLPIFFKLQ